MDLQFFADPNFVPRPREEIRVELMTLTPYPDGRRVRVEITLTPFAPSDRPNIEITVNKSNGAEVASLTIVESVQRTFGITLHLRENAVPEGLYTFRAELYYREQPIQHIFTNTLNFPDDIFTEGAT